MNWDRIEVQWKEIKGKIREKWGKITDDDLDVIAGKREKLEGTLQRIYGKTREEAKKEVDDFVGAWSD